jgi:hypothetical protein
LLPGDGVIPLAAVVEIAVMGGHDPVIGVEVFNRALGELTPDVRAARAKSALDRILVGIGHAG